MESKSWPLAPSQGMASSVFTRPNSVMNMLGGGTADFAQLYWSQPWVHALVNKLTRSVARLELKTYEYDGKDHAREAPKSVPAKVLRNPYERAGSFQLKEFIMGSLCVHGNATLVKFRGGNGQTPAELWPMPFQRVTIIEGRAHPIVAYQYAGVNTSGAIGMKPITFLPEDIIHFSWFNPDGKPWGRSPLEALATTLALENAGQRYALSSFGNNARPASFITSEQKLTKEQRDTLKAEIESAYGGPDNAFKVALLDNGLEWKPVGGGLKESGLVDNRRLSREEVCAVFDIPPPLVGILDNATYSNISEQHVMLYQTTIAPILTMLEDTLNAQFTNELAWDDLFVKFDMGEVTRGDYEKRTQGYQREFMSGMVTPNELRQMAGRSPIGNPDDPDNAANQIYVPVNTAPVDKDGQVQAIGQDKPADNAAADEASAEADTKKPAAKKPAAKKPAVATQTKARKPRAGSKAARDAAIAEILAIEPPALIAA